MDSLTTLDEGGVVWVLTPKSGREGYVPPADIEEAAPTAGLHVTTISRRQSSDWAATRLVADARSSQPWMPCSRRPTRWRSGTSGSGL